MLSGSMLSFDAQGLWESVAQWVGPEVLSKRLSPFLHVNMVTDTCMDTITFFFIYFFTNAAASALASQFLYLALNVLLVAILFA